MGDIGTYGLFGCKNVASQMRHFCAKPEEALRLLLYTLPQQNGRTK
jgi:hypothetical protein